MKYPIGIQTFSTIREDGYAYVDKTAIVYDLVKNGKNYFLSRPRRFGKSLLISTLEAYFRGKRELFKGLAIDNLEKDWKEYPVLHLDLSNANYDSNEVLKKKLNLTVDEWGREYGCNNVDADEASHFGIIIKRAYEQTGRKVVILVDEYDAPLVNLIDKEELLEANRDTLSGFYKNIKANDQYIEFAFLTGVTKFGHLNVFSALNNLRDISLSKQYQTICGITEEELHTYFDEGVGEMAEENDITKEECYGRLKKMYDGYHFCKKGVGLYNPFSLLNALTAQEFGSYWFKTGTPTALIKALRRGNVDIADIPGTRVSEMQLTNVNSYQNDLTALLYQSGYLTITGVAPTGAYIIDFPNEEVRDGFINQLIPIYSRLSGDATFSLADSLRQALLDADIETFISQMRTLISSLSYDIFQSSEQAFHFIFYITGVLIGGEDLRTETEKRTNRGRMDLLIETRAYIYIIEFKLDQSPEVALQQIKKKGYADPWQSDQREKILLGVNFASEERNIPEDGWRMERL